MRTCIRPNIKKMLKTVSLNGLMLIAACGEMAKQPISSGIGASPVLPGTNKTLIPTINIASAIGWSNAKTPLALGTRVSAFVSGLEHPRWLTVVANGMFVGQHYSWNRNPRSGNKVIFVSFVNGKPAVQPIDVLTGFVNDKSSAYGRPVGVTLDNSGALLVADDVGNTIWQVTSNDSAINKNRG